MGRQRRLLVLLLLVTSLCAFHASSVRAAGDPVHIVQSGETLYGIALHYNTTVAHLATVNNIVNPSLIFSGQRLLLTDTPKALSQKGPILADGPWWGRVIAARTPIRPQPVDDGIISDPKRPELDAWLFYGDTVQVLRTVSGEEVFQGNGYWYLIEAEEPQYIHSAYIMPIDLPGAPALDDVQDRGKWIGIYLDQQLIVAYEGSDTIYRTLISGGKTYPTPQGVFRISGSWRPATRRMAGGQPGDSDYYDLPGVRWVSYFTREGHALHGTYWHHRFGQPMSHGCINMTNYDARFFYEWAPGGGLLMIS